jgi:hypothetical protein
MLSVANKHFTLSVANKPFTLSVIMLNFVMLSVIMLNVIMLNVIMLNVVMLVSLRRGKCSVFKLPTSLFYYDRKLLAQNVYEVVTRWSRSVLTSLKPLSHCGHWKTLSMV